MTYNETAAIVYRVVSAYPFYARQFTDDMVRNMVREWHEGLRHVDREGAMEAVTALIVEQKWMPSLSEIITKILDIQLGDDSLIIRDLDRLVSCSSNCIIFGQVTEDQERGYEKLNPFQKLIIKSPGEFNLWLMKDHEWKEERVRQIKREVSCGRHIECLSDIKQERVGFSAMKALGERK